MHISAARMSLPSLQNVAGTRLHCVSILAAQLLAKHVMIRSNLSSALSLNAVLAQRAESSFGAVPNKSVSPFSDKQTKSTTNAVP